MQERKKNWVPTSYLREEVKIRRWVCLSYESLNTGKRRFFCQQATYKGKYGKAKEAVESTRAGLSPQEGDVRRFKKRKRPRKARRWLQWRQGLNQEFPSFWFTSIWVWKRPVSVEVSAPTRLGLRGSPVRRKFRKRTTLRSKSSTLKGLLYTPIQQKQYLKRTTLCRLKIPLQSICSKEGPHYCLSKAWVRKLSSDKRQSTFIHELEIPFVIPYLGYCVAWLTQESVSSRIFVRKKGMYE
jgi:hypothetical protein